MSSRGLELGNGIAVIVALAAAAWLGQGSTTLGVSAATATRGPKPATQMAKSKPTQFLPFLTDATGQRVATGRYRRIVSASTVADELLFELVDRRRILAVTAHTLENHPEGYRRADKPAVRKLTDVEVILRHRPDLVVVSNHAATAAVTRLRELGLRVFDLGPVEALDDLLDDMRTLGALIAEPARGEQLADRFARRMRSVARHVQPDQRRHAIYLSVYDRRLYGGTRGSTYHDILTYAGLLDVAAARHRGWPEYTAAQLLQLDPEVIVTRAQMTQPLCEYPGLDHLRACRTGSVVEVRRARIDDLGMGMLAASEEVHEAIYGP